MATPYLLDGPTTVGDSSVDTTLLGYVRTGGSGNTDTLTGDGSSTIGGRTTTSTLSSLGGVTIGGSSTSAVVTGNGGVGISASGLIGSAAGDINLTLIGGTNTTLYGSGSTVVGSSTQTVRYQPTNSKLFLKDNSVTTKLNTTFTTPGTLTAAAVSGGVIQFTTTAGAYTLPTTAQLCTELLDTSATAFTGTPRHFFQVTFYNTSGGAVTIATGTGQTLTNGTSPISIADTESRTWSMWFTSPTAMLIEDMSMVSGGVTLTNAGTTSLVNDGTGPSLATKGLVAGTAISFSTTATDVTIDKIGVTSLTGTATRSL